jgi:hypothetical protein
MVFYMTDGRKLCHKNDTVTAKFTLAEAIRESVPMVQFKLNIRCVRSVAEIDMMIQRMKARQRPVNKILKHPSKPVAQKW